MCVCVSQSQFMFLLFDLNRCDYTYNGTPKIFENVSLNRRIRVCVCFSFSVDRLYIIAVVYTQRRI